MIRRPRQSSVRGENSHRGSTRSKPAPVFTSAEFELTYYENSISRYAGLFEIRPANPAYSVPASGVDAMDTTPISQCNRLVIVSGSQQGYHVFGESSAEIQRRLAAGLLRNPSGINDRTTGATFG